MKKLIHLIENTLTIGKNFHPFGSIDKIILKRALSCVTYKIPEELIELWEKYGGGDFFETETVLSPTHFQKAENIFFYNENENEYKDLFVFHTGICVSGVDDKGNIYLVEGTGNRIKVENMTIWFEKVKEMLTR